MWKDTPLRQEIPLSQCRLCNLCKNFFFLSCFVWPFSRWFSWAGQRRNVRMGKGGGMPFSLSRPLPLLSRLFIRDVRKINLKPIRGWHILRRGGITSLRGSSADGGGQWWPKWVLRSSWSSQWPVWPRWHPIPPLACGCGTTPRQSWVVDRVVGWDGMGDLLPPPSRVGSRTLLSLSLSPHTFNAPHSLPLRTDRLGMEIVGRLQQEGTNAWRGFQMGKHDSTSKGTEQDKSGLGYVFRKALLLFWVNHTCHREWNLSLMSSPKTLISLNFVSVHYNIFKTFSCVWTLGITYHAAKRSTHIFSSLRAEPRRLMHIFCKVPSKKEASGRSKAKRWKIISFGENG